MISTLEQLYQNHKHSSFSYVRNLCKEVVQYYLLDCISKSTYNKQLVFKGGTCLRICYDLPRLSEDLDFDHPSDSPVTLKKLQAIIDSYFRHSLQYNDVQYKIANNQRTLYIKLPILELIGFTVTPADSNLLIIRIDLAALKGSAYHTKLSVKNRWQLSFFINHLDLPDLFAGKISAILTRETIEENVQVARFKGRDFFDLIWFLEKQISPNWKYLEDLTNLDQKTLLKQLDHKASLVSATMLKSDLQAFHPDPQFVNQFSTTFHQLYDQYKPALIKS